MALLLFISFWEVVCGILRDRITFSMPVNQVSETVKLTSRPYHITCACTHPHDISKQIGKRPPPPFTGEITKGAWLLCDRARSGIWASQFIVQPCIRGVYATLIMYWICLISRCSDKQESSKYSNLGTILWRVHWSKWFSNSPSPSPKVSYLLNLPCIRLLLIVLKK